MHPSPLYPLFGAEICSIDLNEIREPTCFREIVRFMDQYAVCLFRHQHLSNEAHIAFASKFGPLQRMPTVDRGASKPRLPYPELFDISNLDEHGEMLSDSDLRRVYHKGNEFWHTDSSFNQTRAAYSMLYAHEVGPNSSKTEFVDMRVAYESLPEKTKTSIERLVVEHSIWHSRKLGGYPDPTPEELAARPPAQHALVQTHAGSQRKTLYLATHATRVMGLPLDEGRSLLQDLIQHATRPELIYSHSWQEGDMLVWDNRCTMHRVVPNTAAKKKERRDLRRTTAMEVISA